MTNPGGRLPRPVAAPETILIDHSSRLKILERVVTTGVTISTGGGGGTASLVILEDGVPISTRGTLNFASGIVAQDNPTNDRVDISVAGGGTGGSTGSYTTSMVLNAPDGSVFNTTVSSDGRLTTTLTTATGDDFVIFAVGSGYYTIEVDNDGRLISTDIGATLSNGSTASLIALLAPDSNYFSVYVTSDGHIATSNLGPTLSITDPPTGTTVTAVSIQAPNGTYYQVEVDNLGRLNTTSASAATDSVLIQALTGHYFQIGVDNLGRLNTTDIGLSGAAEDVAIASPNGHYWRLGVGINGSLNTIDIGTTTPTGNDPAGSTEITLLAAELSAHLLDAIAAHAASAISFTPYGTISATNVQDAIREIIVSITGTGLQLPNFTTATKPAANTLAPGTQIYVSDAAVGAKVQVSTGSAWE
jgi:hypothetical protein